MMEPPKAEIIGDENIMIHASGGPWEKSFYAYLRDSFYGKTVQQFLENPQIPFEKTAYAEHAQKEYFDCGRVLWNLYSSLEEMRTKIEGLRKLTLNIRLKGYDWFAAKMLERGPRHANGYPLLSGPISLVIKDDGSFDTFYIPDGLHRMSILAVIGSQIPVHVAYRESEWNQLRLDLYERWNRKYLYTPIPHPDFNSWEIGRGNDARFQAVENFIRAHDLGANVLDAGCHFGYQLWRLINNGAVKSGAAFDFDSLPLRVADPLLTFYGIKPEKADAYAYFRTDRNFSCVLATGLVYHIIESYNLNLTDDLLNRMAKSAPVIFFDDDGIIKAEWPEMVKEIGLVNYTQKKTGMSLKKIGYDPEFNRSIYALRRAE